MKKTIFRKIFVVLLVAGIIPLLIFTLLEYKSIQDLSKEVSLIEGVNKEVVSKIDLLSEDIQISTLLIFFFTGILIIFEATLISRGFISPLKKLIQAAEKARKGNFAIKVNIKTDDEFEELGNTFNQMIENLNKAHKSLEESKNVLEIKVRARTKELEEFSKGLDDQVKQKTKELQEKLEEMEKFQKLSIGRELKMVELKEEIKKLKGEKEP